MKTFLLLAAMFTTTTAFSATQYAFLNCRSHADHESSSVLASGFITYDNEKLIVHDNGIRLQGRWANTVGYLDPDATSCRSTFLEQDCYIDREDGEEHCLDSYHTATRNWNKLRLFSASAQVFLNCGPDSSLTVYDSKDVFSASVFAANHSEYKGGIDLLECLTNDIP